MKVVLLAVGLLLAGEAAYAESKALPADAQQIVQAATRRVTEWDGPREGPAAVKDKTIALIAEDLHNGGILGVAQGVREAASVIGWKVKVFDAAGTKAGRDRAAAEALASTPSGLILVGADAKAMHGALQTFTRRSIPVVGWHVGSEPGLMVNSPVAINVSTDPIEVARITAMAAVVASGGRAGVVVFTDSNFEIAMTKAKAMAYVVRACKGCTLLEVRDVAISRSAELMPEVTRELLARHGERWTHALAINDIYFDYAVPELIKADLPSERLSLMSAGDGSAAAFLRIRAGTFQTATVAEPLNLHGWQLVDELNRLLAGRPASGYVMPVHLVTRENIAYDGGGKLQFDPDNAYREAYRRIWRR